MLTEIAFAISMLALASIVVCTLIEFGVIKTPKQPTN